MLCNPYAAFCDLLGLGTVGCCNAENDDVAHFHRPDSGLVGSFIYCIWCLYGSISPLLMYMVATLGVPSGQAEIMT